MQKASAVTGPGPKESPIYKDNAMGILASPAPQLHNTIF
jgi:hypothetical protein